MSEISDIQNKAKAAYKKKQRSKKRTTKNLTKEAYQIAAVLQDQLSHDYNHLP